MTTSRPKLVLLIILVHSEICVFVINDVGLQLKPYEDMTILEPILFILSSTFRS